MFKKITPRIIGYKIVLSLLIYIYLYLVSLGICKYFIDDYFIWIYKSSNHLWNSFQWNLHKDVLQDAVPVVSRVALANSR